MNKRVRDASGTVNITHEEKDTVLVVSVHGSLDALTAPQLSEYLAKQLGAGKSKFVLNLAGLEYTSSAGLRVILNAAKESRQSGGDLRIAAARPTVKKVLEMSGFTTILKTFAEVDAAVQSFS